MVTSRNVPEQAQIETPLRSLAALVAGGVAAGAAACAAEAPPAAAPAPAAAAPPGASNDSTAQWRVLTDVGRDLARQGRHADAESFFIRAVDAARRGFGPGDPHVASACQNLAELYRVQRRYAEAAPLYESALAVLAEAYGAADVRVAFALHNVAGLYFSQRQYDLAAERYEQALQIKRATLGPGHSETTNTAWHLAEVCWAAGRRAEGSRLAAQALGERCLPAVLVRLISGTGCPTEGKGCPLTPPGAKLMHCMLPAFFALQAPWSCRAVPQRPAHGGVPGWVKCCLRRGGIQRRSRCFAAGWSRQKP